MAFDDFRSLIYELSSFTLELSRPLDDYGETNPYRIAFMALQGWRHVMTATFEPLFRHHSDQQVARNRQALINTLLHLLPTAWDMASKRSFGPDHHPQDLAEELGVPPLNRQELLRNNPNKEEIELYFKLTSPLETLEPEMASMVHNLRVLSYEFTPSHLRPRGH
ncbi:hypothetical protein C6P46_006028 [Rhodotorula mucilaginosa]|uniref:Uncharacterized protein n=1 Tax=Rhodotorula mucilaginosa TaxID=5537 RepID=A0A9P7B4J3_RHOMI|nr:hypothetical protein C6P46_006028 [Rhodotorula mucilaginosa]